MNNLEINVKFIQKSRRSTIRVLSSKAIRITVPVGTSKNRVNELISLKSDWIFKKIKILKENEITHKNTELQFTEGSQFPFEGEILTLQLKVGPRDIFRIDSRLIIQANLNKIENKLYLRNKLIKWCQENALSKIKERVQIYSNLLGVQAKSVALKNYRSRWGACSSTKHLFFNWQIILLKPNLLNYVVAHEVCHLIEMNHSLKFYALIDKLGFNKKLIHNEMKNLKNIF